jgi:arylsulfatase A-like enzyme
MWGDHGYQVGEKDRWEKFTLWDRGTHTTLIMSGPGFASGVEIDGATNLLDIYPTLTDYAGIATPGHLSGRSLRRFIDGVAGDEPTKLVMDENGKAYQAIRSEDWNYVRNLSTGTEELYNRVIDPEEFWNVADNPANDAVKAWLVPEADFGLLVYVGVAGLICLALAPAASRRSP